jgi:hypothetical protein
MWDVTEWAVVTWLKVTTVLAVIVGAFWLAFGPSSAAFALACLGAGLAEPGSTVAFAL